MWSFLHPLLALLFAPLLQGIITKTKAFFAGRQGPPLLQPYYDIAKLLRKGAVYSDTTTPIFRIGPVLGITIGGLCLVFLPLGNTRAVASFQGDLIFVVYLLALHRFFTVIAAMDTGSAFEGMAASREMTFSALAEPALLFSLAALARKTGSLSLSGLIHNITPTLWKANAPALTLVVAGLLALDVGLIYAIWLTSIIARLVMVLAFIVTMVFPIWIAVFLCIGINILLHVFGIEDRA